MLAQWEIFFASGSKGKEVRGNGKGGHMARGYYFLDQNNACHGPFSGKRKAQVIGMEKWNEHSVANHKS